MEMGRRLPPLIPSAALMEEGICLQHGCKKYSTLRWHTYVHHKWRRSHGRNASTFPSIHDGSLKRRECENDESWRRGLRR